MKHLVRFGIAAVAIGLGWLAWSHGGLRPEPEPAPGMERAAVVRGEFAVNSAHQGVVESRRMETVASRFPGPATLVELVAEGASVGAGEVLARFDASEIRTRLMKLEKDLAMARSELRSLELARLPLQLKELELALDEALRKLDEEQDYLDDSIELQRENMLPQQEVLQQERKVRNLGAEVERARLEFELTRDYLQPADLAKARTAVFAAEQSLEVAREQLRQSEIRAPGAGVVVYKPLTIGNEFRRVRVGDTIYPNQPFMVLPDMSDLVAVIDIPESELEKVSAGAASIIQPVAFPDLRLVGEVENIGAVAQSIPGKPDWQKYFHVVIGLDEHDSRLRPGMSVIVQVISYHVADALLVPRRAIHWVDGEPLVRVLGEDGTTLRRPELGRANLDSHEVVDGLAEGETVLLR